MYESESQKEVTTAILTGKVTSLSLGITDNELLVIVDIGNTEAVYTADEARELAEEILEDTKQNDVDNSAVANYIFDLADVVDGKKTAEEIRK